jgi:hypothetical protein
MEKRTPEHTHPIPVFKRTGFVRAFEIHAVIGTSAGKTKTIIPVNAEYPNQTVDQDFIERYDPKQGDYFIFHCNGQVKSQSVDKFLRCNDLVELGTPGEER